MTLSIIPYSLRDAPALIEKLLPVQKLSAESYKEQMAGSGKTLTTLGGYWKGRKPLILVKACVLGCLLPSTDQAVRDLEIFEMLMAMDDESFVVRSTCRPNPFEICATLPIEQMNSFFIAKKGDKEIDFTSIDWSNCNQDMEITWRDNISEKERRRIEAQVLPHVSYRENVSKVRRPEEVIDNVHDHIWDSVNDHLGTSAHSMEELVYQLGIMRYGHRPRVADTFCGSGQIPFEAGRLGCDVYASDLNPVACMLTYGAFNIVGGSNDVKKKLEEEKKKLIDNVLAETKQLGIETDGNGWQAKTYLYCLEARCPQTGWMVPLLPTRIVSNGYRVIAKLIPDVENKRYDIDIQSAVSDIELAEAAEGTVTSDGKGQDPYLIHTVDGRQYRTKISTLRGDYRKEDGSTGNKLRFWEKSDFKPRPSDVFQERLYCIQWMRPKNGGKKYQYEFRAIAKEDLEREQIVENYVAEHLADWQEKGWVPDLRIEPGNKTDEPIRTRGWMYWHQLWNPRHLLSLGLMRRNITDENLTILFTGVLDLSSKLSSWITSGVRIAKDGSGKQVGGASNNTIHVFYNQALNTFYNYGIRSTKDLVAVLDKKIKNYPIETALTLDCIPASELDTENDIFITDPPYGDAVKYEEILEFFIAWFKKSPPPKFSHWVWDSRRSLAIKGEGEDFRRGMVAAYKCMTEHMPENGIQIIMFTHQSGSIWADMANIVWASGLQVTAAWYVVTETNSPLRDGSYVKGTVLLVCRKRKGRQKTSRDELAWEIQEEVEVQVEELMGLNQKAKNLYRDTNVFEDADIQMAGYAAALRVLTCYSIIDGRDMTSEAIRPRVKGEVTFVDSLIAFAVDTANQSLVPQGIEKLNWEKLSGAERFYIKMLEMEGRGAKKLDNYQNFAKAFKVRDFHALMESVIANNSRLKSAAEFGRSEMSEGSELWHSVLRAVLYSIMEIENNVDSNDVLSHLTLNIPNYYSDTSQRELASSLADYLAGHLEALRPQEASAARIIRDLIKNQRLG